MKTPLLVAVLALSPLVSCASSGETAPSPPDESGAVRFESIARQEQSSLSEPARQVLRTAPAWQATWEHINTYRMPAPPAPEVDFGRDMVVLVALGERSSTGHAVEIVGIERVGGFLRVRAQVTGPQPGSEQSMVLTHPFHAVRVPRSDGPVEIVLE